MKIPTELVSTHSENKVHQFCLSCFKETIARIEKNGLTYYHCSSCKKIGDRSLVFDPKVTSWIESDREYWHESAGVFVYSNEKKDKILLFKRNIFPFKWTVPSGHIDVGETAIAAAKRELQEEVGLTDPKLQHVLTEKIVGDSCRRGSDAHIWHAYTSIISKNQMPQMHEEGSDLRWVNVTELDNYDVTFPVRCILRKMYDRTN